MTQVQTEHFKELIEKKRDELVKAIRAQAAGITIVESEHDPIDQMQSMSMREASAGRLAHMCRVLSQVDRSLEAISNGWYGLCADCEEPISLKRLQVIPWASHCVGCQERLERLEVEELKAA